MDLLRVSSVAVSLLVFFSRQTPFLRDTVNDVVQSPRRTCASSPSVDKSPRRTCASSSSSFFQLALPRTTSCHGRSFTLHLLMMQLRVGIPMRRGGWPTRGGVDCAPTRTGKNKCSSRRKPLHARKFDAMAYKDVNKRCSVCGDPWRAPTRSTETDQKMWRSGTMLSYF